MHQVNKLSLSVLFALSGLTLTGCGGGSSTTTDTNNQQVVQPPATSSWQAGKFDPSSEFKDQCAVVRTGNDPYNDNKRFPDKAGS